MATLIDESGLRNRPQMAVRLAAQLSDQRVHDSAPVLIPTIGNGGDEPPACLHQNPEAFMADGLRPILAHARQTTHRLGRPARNQRRLDWRAKPIDGRGRDYLVICD